MIFPSATQVSQTFTMNQCLILLLVLCASVTAMVPRDKRALNTEDEEVFKSQSTTTSTTPTEVCAKQTPCAWSIYRPIIKYIEINITNTYCECPEGEVCIVTEDNSTINAYVHRCRKA